MKIVVYYKNGYVNLTGTHIEREENVIFAYNGDELIGFFDLGVVDMCYVSGKDKVRETNSIISIIRIIIPFHFGRKNARHFIAAYSSVL